ncbi:MAG: hypothetical protein ACOYLM_00750 [Methylococcaceae bacterium]
MEQEKDNFWLYIGALIVAVIIGVFILKARENKVSGWDNGAIQESKQEAEKQMEKAKK